MTCPSSILLVDKYQTVLQIQPGDEFISISIDGAEARLDRSDARHVAEGLRRIADSLGVASCG